MISVIIPTYNEKTVLKECIESLSAQSLNDFEIVIVDDGSLDGTLEILKNLKKSLPNFKFERQGHLGPGSARNLGAKRAKGNILVFVDADMTFDKEFLKNLTDPIIKGTEKGTFSKEEFVSNWGSLWARLWNINENWEDKRRHPKNYPDHQPVFRAILKTEFDKVHGFTPGGYNDDWSLSEKLGYEAMVSPGAVFYHKNPETLGEVFNHAGWVGKRPYKLGLIGSLIALIRSSFPVSLIVGLYKSLVHREPAFILFKVIYDLGIFIGVISYLITRRGSK